MVNHIGGTSAQMQWKHTPALQEEGKGGGGSEAGEVDEGDGGGEEEAGGAAGAGAHARLQRGAGQDGADAEAAAVAPDAPPAARRRPVAGQAAPHQRLRHLHLRDAARAQRPIPGMTEIFSHSSSLFLSLFPLIMVFPSSEFEVSQKTNAMLVRSGVMVPSKE